MKKLVTVFFVLFIQIIINAQTGNVGVNTTTPTETLDVNGSLRVRKITQIGPLQSAKDSIMVFDTGGVVKYVSANTIVSQAASGNAKVLTNSTIIGDGSTGNELGIAQQGASTGQVLTWNGSTWIPLNAAPVSTSNVLSTSGNTITSNVNGITSTAPAVNNNTLSLSGSTLTSNVNGVTTTQDLSSIVAGNTTNTISTSGNTITSNVNGITSTAPAVNTVSNSITSGQLTTTVNGVNSIAITLPTADGSETKVNAGTNISVTGSGTTSNPYVINNTFTEVDGSTTNELNTAVSTSANTLTVTDAGGSLTAPIVNNNNLSLSGSTLTSNVNGVTSTQDLSSIQTVTTIANTQATGKTIATYTNESNVATDIKETITNLSQNTTTGTITYTKEDATTATAYVVSANANNIISVGTDGGAYRTLKVFDAYDTAAAQTIGNAATTLNLGANRTNLGGIFTQTSNQVTISEAGVYKINYSVGTTVPTGTNEFSSRFWLENGGVEITNSNIIIHAYNGSYNCSSRSIIMQLVAGSVLRIRMERVNNTNMQTIPSCTGLNIEKLN